MKLLPLFIALLLMPFSINSATTYSTGVGTVEFNGKCKDNRPRSKDDHFKAIEKAKKAAWDKYTGKFSAEKMSNYMANSGNFVSELDKYITEYAILETDCSKSRRVYTVAIKASINSTMVDVTLAQFNSSTGTSSALKGKRVAYYIVARKVSSAKSFDTKNTRQSEKVTMIDADESNYSDDTSVIYVKKSEQREYVLSDNQAGVDNAIANSLKRIQTRPMVGASIDVRTGNDGLFDTIRQEFIGNGGNGESNISSNSFVTLVAGFDHPAISGRVEHFLLGTMDAGPPRIDPDTGLTAVDVYVNAQLVWVDMGFEEVLAFVGPIARTGLGADERLAENQALKLAADVAIDELINKI